MDRRFRAVSLIVIVMLILLVIAMCGTDTGIGGLYG